MRISTLGHSTLTLKPVFTRNKKLSVLGVLREMVDRGYTIHGPMIFSFNGPYLHTDSNW